MQLTGTLRAAVEAGGPQVRLQMGEGVRFGGDGCAEADTRMEVQLRRPRRRGVVCFLEDLRELRDI